MDTNINNYSCEEIIDVLKLTENDIKTKEDVLQKTELLVNKIKNTNSLNSETKNEYITFFWNCFQKLNETHRYEISKPSLYPAALPKSVPEIVTVNTYNNEYVRGDVNPLKRETIKNTLIINNKFEKGISGCNFSVTLDEPLSNVISLKVAALEIVNFYYNISSLYNNNFFHIETYIKNKVTGEIFNNYRKKIELPDGYYNIHRFLTVVEPIFKCDIFLSMIELTYDELKGKLYFTLKDTIEEVEIIKTDEQFCFELDFTTMCDVQYMSLGWLLGYRKQFYTYEKDFAKISSLNTPIGYNPESALDFTGTKFFLLEVVDFNNNSPQVLIYNTMHSSSDILAKIPNTSIMTTVIYEDSSDRVFKTRKYFGPVKLQKLRLRLLDEYGIVVNMNNSDFSVTLEVESLDIPYENMV